MSSVADESLSEAGGSVVVGLGPVPDVVSVTLEVGETEVVGPTGPVVEPVPVDPVAVVVGAAVVVAVTVEVVVP